MANSHNFKRLRDSIVHRPGAGAEKKATLKKISVLVDRRRLQYLINALEHSGTIFDDCLLEYGYKYLPLRERQAMAKTLAKRASTISEDFRRRNYQPGDRFDSYDEIITHFSRNETLNPAVYRELKGRLAAVEASVNGMNSPCNLENRLLHLGGIFKMNEAELEVLLLLHLIETDCGIEKLFEELCKHCDVKTTYRQAAKSQRPFSILTGMPRAAVSRALGDGSVLRKAGLVDTERDLADEVSNYLEGNSSRPISDTYFTEYSGDAIPLDSHIVDPAHLAVLQTLIGNRTRGKGTNILFYGPAGVGKTELARSLGRHFGLNIYEIRNIDGESKRTGDINAFRYRAIQACERIADLEQSIIIVDEADSMLNSDFGWHIFSPVAEKGQTNRVLDDSHAFTIWITNRSSGMAGSTRRRFDYSIAFEKLSFEQRRCIWRLGLKKHRLTGYFSDEAIAHLAEAYELSAGGIDVALRNVARIRKRRKKKDDVMRLTESILKAHCKVIDCERDAGDVKKANAPEYSLDGLNIKGDTNRILEIADRFNAHWSKNGPDTEVRNLNLLLYGPPGSGKTEFAKYIARRLNRRLTVKRASDLLSMWVGESEKNIKTAFSEAERDRAVLFIDEADSLFWSREGASHSWEVTQVNELLTNMETFRGMLVCATNFKQILDSAAMRRFNIKMEFDYLKPEGILHFYRLFLSRLTGTDLPGPLAAELGAMHCLTPGDFKTVCQQHLFFEKQDVSHEMLISALQREVESKNERAGKRIGFGR